MADIDSLKEEYRSNITQCMQRVKTELDSKASTDDLTALQTQVRVIKPNTNDTNYMYQIAYVSAQDARIYIRRQKGDGTWTPWGKVCTTTVEDVPVTNISPADTTTFIGFAGNSNCCYCVRNGVCCVTIWDVKISSSGTVSTGVFLPKGATGTVGGFFTGVMDSTAHAFGYVVGNTGELKFDVKDANVQLNGSFSYPVAES